MRASASPNSYHYTKSGVLHLRLAVAPYEVPDGQSLDNYLRGDNLTASVAEWNATKTGPLTFAVSNHLGFLRFPDDSPLLDLTGRDPAAGPGASHIELVLSVRPFQCPVKCDDFDQYSQQPTWVQFPDPRPATGSFFTISVTVSCPTSRTRRRF